MVKREGTMKREGTVGEGTGCKDTEHTALVES
jgi:hypothetical protein